MQGLVDPMDLGIDPDSGLNIYSNANFGMELTSEERAMLSKALKEAGKRREIVEMVEVVQAKFFNEAASKS